MILHILCHLIRVTQWRSPDIVLSQMKEEFMNNELPEVVRKMKLLGIGIDELKQYFSLF